MIFEHTNDIKSDIGTDANSTDSPPITANFSPSITMAAVKMAAVTIDANAEDKTIFRMR